MPDPITLTLAHSPDPDDAFMWWALTPDESGRAPLGDSRLRFETEMLDIETLNHLSTEARYDITAISCAQYPYVADRYAITSCGASFGLNYGPKLVTRERMSIDELRADDRPVAVPGMRTTAALVTGMILECGRERFKPIPFDEVIERVASGDFDAGVVIHEGQLTYEQAGLHLVCDVGAWWHEQHDLPLPLGLNVIRRDLDDRFGEGTLDEAVRLLRNSIDLGLARREEAVAYAMRFARGVTAGEADSFIRMYVNDRTRDCGEAGRRAIQTLLSDGAGTGILPGIERIEVIEGERIADL